MSYYRHIRTTQERRKFYSFLEIENEYRFSVIRAKRSFKRIPSSYDDICCSAWKDRSWKRYRNNQWKVKLPREKKVKAEKRVFDTPMVRMSKYPFQWLRDKNRFPYRVRFKYIKNKTA